MGKSPRDDPNLDFSHYRRVADLARNRRLVSQPRADGPGGS
jgi:hypothetical protein